MCLLDENTPEKVTILNIFLNIIGFRTNSYGFSTFYEIGIFPYKNRYFYAESNFIC